MKPGIQLDVLIAERVLGLKVVKTEYTNRVVGVITVYSIESPSYYDEAGEMILSNPVPNYSTDIDAAWEVIEKLKKSQIRISNKALQGKYWWVYIDDACAQGSTLPEAICLAALKSFGIETER